MPTFLEPAQNHSEALTRTVEAMQRTQLEQARQQGERERWQMHALVESQRSMALICTSLIERLKPASTATANDLLAILKKQVEADELLDRIAERRNGGVNQQQQVVKHVEEDDENDETGFGLKDAIGAFVGSIAGPLAPAANDYLRAQTYKMMGLQPEQIAAKMEAEARGTVGAASTPSSDDDVWTYRRALRQVQGELSDEDVEIMDAFFSSIDDKERESLFAQADAIVDLDERVQWTRNTIAARVRTPNAAPQLPSVPLDDVPPAFRLLLEKLTPDEEQTAVRIVKKLDVATTRQIGLELLGMPPAAQLAKVREMIKAFEQREASTAQRAAFSIFKKDAA